MWTLTGESSAYYDVGNPVSSAAVEPVCRVHKHMNGKQYLGTILAASAADCDPFSPGGYTRYHAALAKAYASHVQRHLSPIMVFGNNAFLDDLAYCQLNELCDGFTQVELHWNLREQRVLGTSASAAEVQTAALARMARTSANFLLEVDPRQLLLELPANVLSIARIREPQDVARAWNAGHRHAIYECMGPVPQAFDWIVLSHKLPRHTALRLQEADVPVWDCCLQSNRRDLPRSI
jgi:hypothetical protein